MPSEYFGCWNRTYGDWRNTETGSEQICSSKGVVMTGAKTAAYSLGHVDGDAPCLVARQQISGGSATGLVPIVQICERLPVVIANDEARAVVLNLPREARCSGWSGCPKFGRHHYRADVMQ